MQSHQRCSQRFDYNERIAVFFIFVLSLASAILQALPVLAADQRSSAKYAVLLFDNIRTRVGEADKPEKWSTIVADAMHLKRIDGLLVNDGQNAGMVEVVHHQLSPPTNYKGHEFNVSYETLEYRPLGSQEKTELMTSTLPGNTQDETSAYKYIEECDKERYHSAINVLSLYQKHVALETMEENPDDSEFHRDRGMYELEDGELNESVLKLPAGYVTMAQKQFDKAGAGFSPSASHDWRCDRDNYTYAVSPTQKGLIAEFVFPPGGGDGFFFADVKLPLGLIKTNQQMQQAFVRNHPKLLAWKTIPFYSVAPDCSAVVYVQRDSSAYWKYNDSTPAHKIAKLELFRGMQWINKEAITKMERQTLGF